VVLFVVMGGLAAAVNMASRFAFSAVMPLPAAVIAAYLVGMCVAFCLNRTFVFQGATDQTGRRILRFTMVNLVAVAQTLAITIVGSWLMHPPLDETQAQTLAHAVGVVVPVLSSYWMHRRWTFSRQP